MSRTSTTQLREKVLHLIREERKAQIDSYGSNDDLLLGFGSPLSYYPWLFPYSDAEADKIEAAFRVDYGRYEGLHGKPTWMHLIREEVAELFKSTTVDGAITEAIQVAALATSLVEHLLEEYAEDGVLRDPTN